VGFFINLTVVVYLLINDLQLKRFFIKSHRLLTTTDGVWIGITINKPYHIFQLKTSYMNFTPQFIKKSSKIIALDDDPIFGMLLRKHFEHLSQELSAAGAKLDYKISTTSRDGLRDFDESCDVMILDYLLDELDDSDVTGLDIIDEVIDLSPNTKVIVVSGKKEESIKRMFMNHGASSFIEKDSNTIARIMNFLHHELAA
tara:strand:- start:288 stop:887 length:600 start_codon:yes stop_codon:yes gene_type:complete